MMLCVPYHRAGLLKPPAHHICLLQRELQKLQDEIARLMMVIDTIRNETKEKDKHMEKVCWNCYSSC